MCCCFPKDSLYRKVATIPKNNQFDFIVNQKMIGSFDSMMKHFVENPDPSKMNQQILEAVGGLRFALKFAADCISQRINSDCSTVPLMWHESEVKECLKQAKKSCFFQENPRLFLFKLLYRRHGSVMVDFCTKTEPHLAWLVSGLENLRVSEEHYSL